MSVDKQTPAVRLFFLQLILEMLKSHKHIQDNAEVSTQIKLFSKIIQKIYTDSKDSVSDNDTEINERITLIGDQIENLYDTVSKTLPKGTSSRKDIVWQ